jgi:hypothetical protein
MLLRDALCITYLRTGEGEGERALNRMTEETGDDQVLNGNTK